MKDELSSLARPAGEKLDVLPAAGYRRGELVEVRSLSEIMSTLDAGGTLEGMPFMPEMARYCGQTLKVYRRAAKTCVEGLGVRGMMGSASVFLQNVRCDGAAHDNCQRGCLIFWKEAWLKKKGSELFSVTPAAENSSDPFSRLPTRKNDGYFCQSTELTAVTRVFPRWNLRAYWHDLMNGELTLPRLARILGLSLLNKFRHRLGLAPCGQLSGDQEKPSKGDLDLQPGEWVEVKSRREIEATLDAAGKNRGLSFEAEMIIHCGRRYQVAFQVRRIINEETARLIELTNTVVLDGVTCQGICGKNCPRRNYFYWREIWLRRV